MIWIKRQFLLVGLNFAVLPSEIKKWRSTSCKSRKRNQHFSNILITLSNDVSPTVFSLAVAVSFWLAITSGRSVSLLCSRQIAISYRDLLLSVVTKLSHSLLAKASFDLSESNCFAFAESVDCFSVPKHAIFSRRFHLSHCFSNILGEN